MNAPVGKSLERISLVHIDKNVKKTNSIKLADFFDVEHKVILAEFDNLKILSQDAYGRKFLKKNFLLEMVEGKEPAEIDVINMTTAGAFMITQGLPGMKAVQARMKMSEICDAFDKLVQERLVLRSAGKKARRLNTDVIQLFVIYATVQGSKNAKHYYKLITNMEYKALGLIEKGVKVKKDFRDTLDAMDQAMLAGAEVVCRQALEEGMTRGLEYKKIYILAKDRVVEFAAGVPDHQIEDYVDLVALVEGMSEEGKRLVEKIGSYSSGNSKDLNADNDMAEGGACVSQ